MFLDDSPRHFLTGHGLAEVIVTPQQQFGIGIGCLLESTIVESLHISSAQLLRTAFDHTLRHGIGGDDIQDTCRIINERISDARITYSEEEQVIVR